MDIVEIGDYIKWMRTDDPFDEWTFGRYIGKYNGLIYILSKEWLNDDEEIVYVFSSDMIRIHKLTPVEKFSHEYCKNLFR